MKTMGEGRECCECGKQIREAEPMRSVSFNREIFEDGAITVLESDVVYISCEDCATVTEDRKALAREKG